MVNKSTKSDEAAHNTLFSIVFTRSKHKAMTNETTAAFMLVSSDLTDPTFLLRP